MNPSSCSSSSGQQEGYWRPPRERYMSPYSLLQRAHMRSSLDSGSNNMGSRSGTANPFIRNDYERYGGNYGGISDATLLAAAASLSSQTVLPGYIPPGTHHIPPGFHPMGPLSSRMGHPQSQRHQPFLPPLRDRSSYHSQNYNGAQSSSSNPDMYAEDGPLFPSNYEDENTFYPLESLVLPPIRSGGRDHSDGIFGDYLSFDDKRAQDRFDERRASFPELPMDAHKRIFQMGNEIVDCFEVHLDRFYRGALLDTAPRSVAVFTKKERTGQRWLMVFKEDVSRSIIKFNRLLTHSLIVSIKSKTAVEIEAAKAVYGPPAEMCVLNFRNAEETTRFYGMLQESQSTAWNHREVSQEQEMKNRFNRLNLALSGNPTISEYEMSNLRDSNRPPNPLARSPFTLTTVRDPQSPYLAASGGQEGQFNVAADCDPNWRVRAETYGQTDQRRSQFHERRRQSPAGPHSQPRSKPPVGSTRRGTAGPTPPTRPFVYNSLTHTNALKTDGSGDGPAQVVPDDSEEIELELPESTLFVKKAVGESFGYEELGRGKLQVVTHGDSALDEIRFLVGGDADAQLFQQFIFKWNNASKIEERHAGDRLSACLWNGAASLIHSPNDVPETRDFKVYFPEEELATKFLQAFDKGVEKGKNGMIRKSHLDWYIAHRAKSTISTSS